jgi:DNA-binding NarL/FixJ family response regulator
VTEQDGSKEGATMDRIAVLVHATDPISQAGVVSQLRASPEIQVINASGNDPQTDTHDVSLVVVDEVDESALRQIRACSRNGNSRTVLVASRVDDAALVKAVEAGVVGLVMRNQATTQQLLTVLCGAARGDGAIPPDMLGRLLVQVGRLQRQILAPRGLTFAGLAQREIDVLRLVAEGLDTAEIAAKLSYSERTVKNVLHEVTSRMQLRNRPQAVAYAIREGLI